MTICHLKTLRFPLGLVVEMMYYMKCQFWTKILPLWHNCGFESLKALHKSASLSVNEFFRTFVILPEKAFDLKEIKILLIGFGGRFSKYLHSEKFESVATWSKKNFFSLIISRVS